MTEEEAKTKWCPQTLGRTPPNPECCAGSSCMAWRVATRTEWRDRRTGQLIEPGMTFLRGETVDVQVEVGGFCGLARRPA
jgi:hypothetical protein